MRDEIQTPVGLKFNDEMVRLGNEAVIDDGVILGYLPSREWDHDGLLTIGPGARIRSGTVVYGGSIIVRNLETGHNVVIREENNIGDDLCIWSNSIIDYGCRIGNKVKIHSGVYITQFTVIEDEVFIAPGATLANDIHPGCPDALECMQGPCIKQGAQIGINSCVLPRVVIGEFAIVGAGSVVTKDIPARMVACGNPAKVVCKIEELTCTTGLRDRPYSHLTRRT